MAVFIPSRLCSLKMHFSWNPNFNPGHNILELYIILVQIRFTTSNMKLDI